MPYLCQLAQFAITKHCGVQVNPQAYWATSGIPFAQQIEKIVDRLSKGRQAAVEEFENQKKKFLEHSAKPFSDVKPASLKARQLGIELAICSSTEGKLIRHFLDRHGLLHDFTTVLGLERGSKEQQLVFLLSKKPPSSEILFVGDSFCDAVLADRAGVAFAALVRPSSRVLWPQNVRRFSTLVLLFRTLERVRGAKIWRT